MATTITIPVEMYLATSYRPDRDYVDGEVQERHLGEQWHASVQTMIASIFARNRHDWRLRPLVEQRVQVAANRYRVPDICAVEASEPLTRILQRPPVLCVEVLSPEDRFRRTVERCREYRAMGVPNIWIIQPRSREIWTLNAQGEAVEFEGADLTLPGTPVTVSVTEIFALIDEAPALQGE